MEGTHMGNFVCESNENAEKKKKNSNYYEYSDINTYYKENNVYNTSGVVGLYNLGNTCYMNSLLQCLKSLFPLTDYIFTHNFKGGKLINSYKKLLYNLISTKNEITDALEYYNDLGKIDSYFASHEQRDSSRLFLTHIKILIEDSKNYNYRPEIDPKLKNDEPNLYNKYINAKEKNPSFIYDLFFGYTKTINKCVNCDKIINTIYQPFSLINLFLRELNGKYIKDLYNLINNLEEPKTLNMLCKCGSKIIQQNFLTRIPQILVFKFERVVNGRHVNHEIKYPNILYMKKYSDGFIDKYNNEANPELKFNLVGVMLHYGGAYGGHKTSYSKNFIDKNWYYFNDSSKRIESEESILDNEEAFMLFYVSDSCYISDEDIKSIINDADKYSTHCNYSDDRYKNIYNYNNNICNNIRYDSSQSYNVESKEIKQNNDFKNNKNNINSINVINNINTNNSSFTDNMNMNNKPLNENKPIYKNQNDKVKTKNRHSSQNNFNAKKYYYNIQNKNTGNRKNKHY